MRSRFTINFPLTKTTRTLLLTVLVTASAAVSGKAGEAVNESARAIPVAYQVDVVVVGGSTGAVAAAVEAARTGAKVFLAAERPYLGDDMAGTLRLWPQPGDELDTPLARQLFTDAQIKSPTLKKAATSSVPDSGLYPPRPMHVKKTLDEALLAAGVQFLYSCFPTDVLRDAQDRPCGIVMANRAGRQAVIAKVVIDATQRALVARMAGAKFRPFPSGSQTMKFVVIGGQVHSGAELTARIAAAPYRGVFPNPAKTSSGDYQVIEYTAQIPMSGDTDAAWATAEQHLRSQTYDPEQQFTSDVLYHIPPDSMHGRQTGEGPWRGSQEVPLDAMRPADVSGLYVLGACADISRPAAEHLLQPGSLIVLGTRVGRAAAEDAASQASPEGIRLPGAPTSEPAAQGEVREILAGIRPAHQWTAIPQEARSLPVLGHFDVVVVGGGTSGSPAGIASARQGAKTLIIEQHHGLGGMGTLGTVTSYFGGNRTGFTRTVPGPEWIIEQKMQWWRDEFLKAGGELWFGSVGCGAFVESGQVSGVVVATPRGRGVVLAKVVIDTTGNADIAAAAGAECRYTDENDFAIMGGGVAPRSLGLNKGGPDFCIVDETDVVDVWHLSVYAKDKYPKAFDQGPIIVSRERRRIVGDYTLTILDELNDRTYPDTIAVALAPFDCGGAECYTLDPALLAMGTPESKYINIPYRCCLPKGLDGILVGAVGLSVQHDALPMIRMQADMQNLGYALGVAAAMTTRTGASTRQLDVRTLQSHLVEIGNVPKRVSIGKDSYPLPENVVTEAVEKLNRSSAPVILSHSEQALPKLRAAYAASEDPNRRMIYARLLGILGDPLGSETLMDAVRGESQWDKGWDFRWDFRKGNTNPPFLLSQVDRDIIILGRTGDRRAVAVVVEKLKLLTADREFSHHRAVALALESLADPSAAEPLAALLGKPGMSGHSCPSIEVARQREQPPPDRGYSDHDVKSRQESLRELMLARALYRCGDAEGLGEKTLRRYVEDLRGHLSRHAQAVLNERSKP